MLTLRQIEVFRAVMRARTVVGAASRLRITQPTVTRTLRRVEDALRPVLDANGVIGVHLGVEDRAAAAAHPLHATWTANAGEGEADPGRFALLIEGADAGTVIGVTGSAAGSLLQAIGAEVRVSTLGAYDVATWVERSHLPPLPGRQPPRPDPQLRLSAGDLSSEPVA